MNIRRSLLKWMLLGLGLWALAPVAEGQQDTLHLFMSDTVVYRETGWNKKFSITISAQAPYPSTTQFSFMIRPFPIFSWPTSEVYNFKLTKIVPLDTPTVDLSHFGTREIGNDIIRIITRITPAPDGKPKALFRLFFEAENPEALEKEIRFESNFWADYPFAFPTFSNTPLEIVAVGPNLKRPVVVTHDKLLSLRRALWPGDVDNNGIVDQYDMLALGLELYQPVDKARPNASLEWKPQEFIYSNNNEPNRTKALWDTDGNAQIDFKDTLAIHQNWGKTVPNRKIQRRTVRDSFSLPLSLNLDTLRNRKEIDIPITLGSAEVPVQNAYGLTFSINYGAGLGNMARISTDFSKTFFTQDKRPIFTYVRKDSTENKLHVVISRLRKRPISGYGEIARVKLTVEDLIFVEPFLKNLNIDPQSIMMIDKNNNPIPVAPGSGEIRIISDIEQASQNPLDQRFNIYPTPCRDVLHVEFEDLNIQHVRIFSQDGKLMQQFQQFNQREIDTSKLPNGAYHLHIESTEGKGVKKFLVQH